MNLGFNAFNRGNFNRDAFSRRFMRRFTQPSAPASVQPSAPASVQPSAPASVQPSAEYNASRGNEAAQSEQARNRELQNNSAPYRFAPIRDTAAYYTAELYEDKPQRFQGIDNRRNKVLELSLMVGALFLFF